MFMLQLEHKIYSDNHGIQGREQKLEHHRINTRLFQLTRYDSITRYFPDADGAKWSHETNKYP